MSFFLLFFRSIQWNSQGLVLFRTLIKAHWKNLFVRTFLQNIMLLVAHFATFFKVKCPVSGTKSMLSKWTWLWQSFITYNPTDSVNKSKHPSHFSLFLQNLLVIFSLIVFSWDLYPSSLYRYKSMLYKSVELPSKFTTQ